MDQSQSVSHEERYRKMIRKIKGSSLLALPQSASRILKLCMDPENGPPELAAVISSDVGLTTQLLRFVNSSYFGFRSKITSVQAALSLVYGQTIKNFILWNAVFSLLPNPHCGPFELKKVCQDSLRRGVFSKIFGGYYSDLDPEELFLNSLFQDVALPILAQIWPDDYAELLQRRQETSQRLSDLEQAHFGWNHALAGAYLAEEWGFDEPFSQAIAAHIHPNFDVEPDNCSALEMRCIIIALAGLLPSVVDRHWEDADRFFSVYFRFIRKGMPYPDAIFSQVETQVGELISISQLDPVSNSLHDFHRQWLETFE